LQALSKKLDKSYGGLVTPRIFLDCKCIAENFTEVKLNWNIVYQGVFLKCYGLKKLLLPVRQL
jgi:hypothetical protein